MCLLGRAAGREGTAVAGQDDGCSPTPGSDRTLVSHFTDGSQGLQRVRDSEPGLWLPGCRSAQENLGKEGWRLNSSPAPSLLCCLLGTPKAGVRLVAGTPVPWVGKQGGNAWGLERLPPLAATVTKAGGTALNPVPLSFRTNTTMLLMKSSRPSGECGTCWGGAWEWGLRWAPAPSRAL